MSVEPLRSTNDYLKRSGFFFSDTLYHAEWLLREKHFSKLMTSSQTLNIEIALYYQIKIQIVVRQPIETILKKYAVVCLDAVEKKNKKDFIDKCKIFFSTEYYLSHELNYEKTSPNRFTTKFFCQFSNRIQF